jgi:hypothetical protein
MGVCDVGECIRWREGADVARGETCLLEIGMRYGDLNLEAGLAHGRLGADGRDAGCTSMPLGSRLCVGSLQVAVCRSKAGIIEQGPE